MRFLKWWVIVCIIGIGLFFFVYYGGIEYVNNADFTKLSFVIFALFLYGSVLVGIRTRKGGGVGLAKYFSSVMPRLGMVGTVLGFIKMLSVCFIDLDIQNPQKMQQALSIMSEGMSTALLTTAAGLIFSILLNVQIFNYEYKREYNSSVS